MDRTGETPQPDWLELLNHTADTGIVVRATTLPELFERAAWGMFSVITDLSCVEPKVTEHLTVDADDLSALLVQWLSELNFRHITQHLLFGKFSVREITEQHLTAEAQGERIDLERHPVYTEIKAVTFHALKVERLGDVWHAQVIFDL